MKTKMITVNQYSIETVQMGDSGKTELVFAHGLGANVRQWEEQLSYFSRDYHVTAFSLQGHGKSSKPDNSDAYSLESYTETALGLLDKLNIRFCVWIGNSMGGILGYRARSAKPGLIKMLITNGTTPELILPGFARKIVKILDTGLIKIITFEAYLKFIIKYSSRYEPVRKKLFTIMQQTYPPAVIASRQALGNYSCLSGIKDRNSPAYIIKAADDRDINSYLGKYAAVLKATGCVSFIPIPNAGHLANLDKPGEYNRIIENILQRTPADGTDL